MRAHAGQLRHPASVASQKSGYSRAPSCQTYAHSPQATHTHTSFTTPHSHTPNGGRWGPASESLRTYLHHAPPEPCGRLLCPLGRGVWRRPHMHTVGGTGAACPRPHRAPFSPQRRRRMLLPATTGRAVGPADLVIRSGGEGGGGAAPARGALDGALDEGRARHRDLNAKEPFDHRERQQHNVEREGQREAVEELEGEAEGGKRVANGLV